MMLHVSPGRTTVRPGFGAVAGLSVAAVLGLAGCDLPLFGPAVPDASPPAAGCDSDGGRPCRPGYYCSTEGSCRPLCTVPDDCSEGETCDTYGHCVPIGRNRGGDAGDGGDTDASRPPVDRCREVRCAAMEVCVNGICVNRCTGNLPCRADETVVLDGVEVDRFEASRPDATAEDGGCNRRRACSVRGVAPWRGVNRAEAEAACAAAGKRLCSSLEWRRACNGGSGTRYPYGDLFDPGACAVEELRPTGTSPRCTSGAGGGYDFSGNLREWVADPAGENRGKTMGGGVGDNATFLSCEHQVEQPLSDRGPTNGFRCCR